MKFFLVTLQTKMTRLKIRRVNSSTVEATFVSEDVKSFLDAAMLRVIRTHLKIEESTFFFVLITIHPILLSLDLTFFHICMSRYILMMNPQAGHIDP